jgi:hypothetical protein
MNSNNNSNNNSKYIDIYEQKILNRNILNGYSCVPHTRKDASAYLSTRDYLHKKNMYDINLDNTCTNYSYFPYQKGLDLHSTNETMSDRTFNSCVYTHTENGRINCTNENKYLISKYFKQNQKINYAILKSCDADLDDTKFGNMFHNMND